MRKIFSITIAVLFAMSMLTACKNENNTAEIESEVSETEITVTENTTDEPFTETTSESADNISNTTVTTTESIETETSVQNNPLTILSEEDLSAEAKEFFQFVNECREKENAEAVVPAKELNECAKKYVGEISRNFFAFSGGTRADGSEFSTLLDEADISYTSCDKIDGMTIYYNIDVVLSNMYYSEKTLAKAVMPEWKYMGFYYDSENLYWAAVFISDDVAGVPETEAHYE